MWSVSIQRMSTNVTTLQTTGSTRPSSKGRNAQRGLESTVVCPPCLPGLVTKSTLAQQAVPVVSPTKCVQAECFDLLVMVSSGLLADHCNATLTLWKPV